MASTEEHSPTSTTILVTGGSGFVGSHVILQLLAAGYTVRATIRNLKREAEVRQALENAGADVGDRLSFIEADLENDAGWATAAKGCTYVHHIASPFPLELPKNEDDIIRPARDGTLRVLKAALDAGVKRVVMTSTIAAVACGHPIRKEPFTENDWTNLDGKIPVQAYYKSKTIAEMAAWDFIKTNGSLELVALNPTGIFGPVLGSDISPSVLVVKKLMDGSIPGCPNLYFAVVDVRDLADLHLRAMKDPAANGERFIAVCNGPAKTMLEMGKIIKRHRPENAKKVPSLQVPNWAVKVMALFDPPLKLVVPQLGEINEGSNEKAKKVLGWAPRSTEDSILDTADSLVQYKLV